MPKNRKNDLHNVNGARITCLKKLNKQKIENAFKCCMKNENQILE